MRRFVKWLDHLPLSFRLLVSSLATAIPFYFAALLAYLVSKTAELSGTWGVALHAFIFLILLTSVVFVSRIIVLYRDEIKRNWENKLAALQHAYAQIDRFVTGSFKSFKDAISLDNSFIEKFTTSPRELQEIVDAAYNTFEAAFGKSAGVEERVDFEVTFMTRSYLDGEITIPASANREGRAPRSMILRKANPKIYENTVTAMVYREPRPTMHIIEDTNKDEYHYQAIYPHQTDRIKSSIVFPVLSDTNELLGTLVVHCDKPDFFKQEDRKFWVDLLEIFSKRLALTKAKMDQIMEYRKENSQLMILIPEFWF